MEAPERYLIIPIRGEGCHQNCAFLEDSLKLTLSEPELLDGFLCDK